MLLGFKFFIFLTILDFTFSQQICESDACKNLAKELKVIMNTKTDPCDDFSSYICGNMDKMYSIESGRNSLDSFDQISSSVTEVLKTLLEKQSITNLTQPQTKAAIFYKSCLNKKDRNKNSEATMLEKVNEINKGNDLEQNLINLLKSGIGSRLFAIEVGQDAANPQYNILNIGKPSFILSEGTLREHESASNNKQITSYVKFMNKVIDILRNAEINKTLIDDIIKLHIRLAKALPSLADQSDPEKYTNKLSIRDLQKKFPAISWLRIINGVLKNTGKQMKENDNLVVFSFEYLNEVNKVFNEYKIDPNKSKILKMDFAWSLISNTVQLASDQLIAANDQFQTEALGVQGKRELWKECVEITSTALSDIVGNMYIKAEFKPSQKKDIEYIIGNIKSALKGVIESLTWMDSVTKKSALIKLKSIIYKIGYPEYLLNETKLTKDHEQIKMDDDKFLGNYIRFLEFALKQFLRTVGEKISPDEWSMGPHVVNAYYNPASNEIVFPAAILRYPFYDIGLPITYNYGSIGYIIGHEILHGFDTQGSKFDEKGLLREWWTPQSRSEYLSKTQCIINQYGNYTINNASLPSLQTVGEDIADNAGIRMSYLAVNSNDEKRHKLTLPDLTLSPEQLFFVAASRIWCTIATKTSIEEQLKADVHTVWKYRINGPISNMPEFSKQYKCDRNKKMNRLKKCLVW